MYITESIQLDFSQFKRLSEIVYPRSCPEEETYAEELDPEYWESQLIKDDEGQAPYGYNCEFDLYNFKFVSEPNEWRRNTLIEGVKNNWTAICRHNGFIYDALETLDRWGQDAKFSQ